MVLTATIMFKKRENIEEIEEGKLLSPKFDNDGLIPVVTTCYNTKEILMHGYMNVEAFKLSIETKEAHYWSRSRKQIWHKEKQVVLFKKLKKSELTMIKTLSGCQLILVTVQVVMLDINLAFIDQYLWVR